MMYPDSNLILLPLYQAHLIASQIEGEIAKILPNSDVLIHTEPHVDGDLAATIRNVALEIPGIQNIHSIIIRKVSGEFSISCHIEIDPKLSISQAHEIASRLEEQIRKKLRNITSVISHLEPASKVSEFVYSPESASMLQRKIMQIQDDFPEVVSLHNIQILSQNGKYNVSLHCTVDASLTVERAHEIATEIEGKIRALDERIDRVDVHCEPGA